MLTVSWQDRPIGARYRIADDIRELPELDARAATGGADMAVEHCFEVVPPLVAHYPLDQPLNAMDGESAGRSIWSKVDEIPRNISDGGFPCNEMQLVRLARDYPWWPCRWCTSG